MFANHFILENHLCIICLSHIHLSCHDILRGNQNLSHGIIIWYYVASDALAMDIIILINHSWSSTTDSSIITDKFKSLREHVTKQTIFVRLRQGKRTLHISNNLPDVHLRFHALYLFWFIDMLQQWMSHIATFHFIIGWNEYLYFLCRIINMLLITQIKICAEYRVMYQDPVIYSD